MKKCGILLLLLASISLAFGQQKESGVVKIRGTRLAYPLINKWIVEFKKVYPNIQVSIAPSAPADSIDFTIAAYALTGKELTGTRSGVAFARYLQLPVANSKRPDLAPLQAHGFSEADFRKLYFTPETPTFFASAQNPSPITLYTREKPACAAKTFATHFDHDPKAIQGVGVKGDDQDLAKAVKADVNGISFNNLGFIYDLNTRHVVEGLAVIPLDLNENGKVDKEEQWYGSLDDVIAYIEKTNDNAFVTENVNFLFNKNASNAAAGIFLHWALTQGQQFNHALGFLSFDDPTLQTQRTLAAATFKTLSASSCEGAGDLMKTRRSTKTGRNNP
jgi:phosphate transport system substrate-binding protein